MANTNVNSQISRMKALMGYGLQTESKQTYSSVEYQKVGADGKTYGIIREGNKYYIKTAPKKEKLVKEDFEYIGGFKNRKSNQYSSYANAQKQFDLKMRSLAEAYSNGKNIIIESWNPSKQQELSVEATDNMRREILRERQIMKNVQLISEQKAADTSVPADGVRGKNTNANSTSETPKDTQGKKVQIVGKPPVGYDGKKLPCKNGNLFCLNPEKGLNEQADVLGFSRDHDDYLDTSNGTKIGSSKPWGQRVQDADAVADAEGGEAIAEGKAMHNTDNQNKPAVGTGEIGDDAPFDAEKGRQLNEFFDSTSNETNIEQGDNSQATNATVEDSDVSLTEDEDFDAEGEDFDAEGEDFDAEGEDFDAEGEDFDAEGEDFGANEDYDDDDFDDEDFDDEDYDDDDLYDDDIEDRLSNVEELLSQIASKLGVMDDVDADDYEDDADMLYDDEEDLDGDDLDDEGETEYDLELDSDADADVDDEDFDAEDEEEDDDDVIYETRAYRNAVRRINEENRLNYFGKHPAYRKKVMTYPTPDMADGEGQYDMNDESVKGEKPYGEKIGSSAPFTISHQQIQNSIAESVNRMLKKK